MNFRNKFLQFMSGRYGVDQFSKFLLTIGILSYICSLFFNIRLWDFISILCIIYCYVRIFSKNHANRSRENQKFLHVTSHLSTIIQGQCYSWKQKKTHHIYKCPNCKQKIRIPRGKGRISVHCPKCNTDFIKNS